MEGKMARTSKDMSQMRPQPQKIRSFEHQRNMVGPLGGSLGDLSCEPWLRLTFSLGIPGRSDSSGVSYQAESLMDLRWILDASPISRCFGLMQ